MPVFRITVLNETFSASHCHELPSVEEAVAQALTAALQIGVEEVTGGQRSFVAEVTIEAHNTILRRFAVTMGTSPLYLGHGPAA